MRWFKPHHSISIEVPQPPDIETQWNLLGLVNDWINHSETKIGAVLAFNGVAGAGLYSLVVGKHPDSCFWRTAALWTTLWILTSGFCCLMGLIPRTARIRNVPATRNPLYFDHVASDFANASEYNDAIRRVTSDRDTLSMLLSAQVYANSNVAASKYKFATGAICALSFGLLGLSGLAILTTTLT